MAKRKRRDEAHPVRGRSAGATADPLRLVESFRRFAPVAVIVVAALAAFANSFSGVFLFDEQRHIISNEAIRSFFPLERLLWSSQRPVIDFTLALNYALGGLRPGGYHALNLLIHIFAGLTLYGLVRRTLMSVGFAGGSNISARWAACAAAVLWVVHPLQTQSVTYVIQRCESLMGLFYLLTLYCVIRGAGSARRGVWYGAAVVACALGMGSKAVMVTAPLVVLLYDRVFLAANWREVIRRRWMLHLGLAATLSIPAFWGVVRGVLSGAPRSGVTVGFAFKGITPLEYALTQLWAIVKYLQLSLWPHPLVLDYGWPVVRDVGTLIVCGVVVFGLLAATAWALWKRPALGFVGAWFFLILAPTSSIIPIRDTIFEHRMYLPLAAVVVLIVLGIHAGLQRMLPNGPAGRRILSTSLTVVAAIALIVGTARRNLAYHSEHAMWQDVISKRPDNPRAYDTIGGLYDAAGRLEEAERYYRAALVKDPAYVNARYNLASVLAKQNRYDEAIAEYRETARLDPFHPFAPVSLGDALVSQGRFEEGVAALRGAIRSDPTNQYAWYFLGNAYAGAGQIEEALEAYREALRVNPRYAEAHYSMGNALQKVGRLDDAVAAYRESIECDPTQAVTHNNLGNALLRQGKPAEAMAAYRVAVRLNPRHANARTNLGNLLRQDGQWNEAVQEYMAALEANTGQGTARRGLGLALHALGQRDQAVPILQAVLQANPGDAEVRAALEGTGHRE